MLDVFFCCHVLLLVIWLGLDVIGVVFVVGLEFGVVGNVVLEGCCFFVDSDVFVLSVRCVGINGFCCECVLSLVWNHCSFFRLQTICVGDDLLRGFFCLNINA